MAESSQDWVEGFLMVGNQPALDLLNTRLLADGQEQELLTDTSRLVQWLVVSGLIPALEMKSKHKGWSERPEAKAFLRQLLTFRESLRGAVLRLEEGRQPGTEFLTDLNERLFAHPMRRAVKLEAGRLRSRQADGTSLADTLWAALLQEIHRLLTDTEPARVRQCESCIVQFLDVSKKNGRRWCSMQICGNRLKVAAYQRRRKREDAAPPG